MAQDVLEESSNNCDFVGGDIAAFVSDGLSRSSGYQYRVHSLDPCLGSASDSLEQQFHGNVTHLGTMLIHAGQINARVASQLAVVIAAHRQLQTEFGGRPEYAKGGIIIAGKNGGGGCRRAL
jgi:hypothetical protein